MTSWQRGDRGRPLRFLGAVAAGWIALRIAMLLPETEPSLPIAARDRVAIARPSVPVLAMTARSDAPRGAGDAEGPRRAGAVRLRSNGPSHPQRHLELVSGSTAPQRQAGQDARWMLKRVQHDAAKDGAAREQEAVQRHPQRHPELVSGSTAQQRQSGEDARWMLKHVQHDDGAEKPVGDPVRRKRWSVSAWAVARAGLGREQAVTGGQLGASQAGIRLVRSLDRRRRVALAGRVTTPLGPGLRETSVGLEWQPTRLPVKLVAEHRFVLGRGNGGPGVAVIGGFGPTALRHGLSAEAYGQAGGIRRARIEPYADAAVRVTHPIGHIGRGDIDLGAGAWGGVQRGAARFDLGPSLSLTLPVRRTTTRLTLDWRERVAGQARPDAGPALTLGTDF